MKYTHYQTVIRPSSDRLFPNPPVRPGIGPNINPEYPAWGPWSATHNNMFGQNRTGRNVIAYYIMKLS
ncbi:predicted protein [Botrytis cinerea T4]|uniref:Uncharacterized protein n=1 Tax=Botryotinia fuckeliana (strain T4) TaxID=999810 RepID=G2YG00_BOTF4|nr:predicted protein [Botrytis cinerea T4]